MPKKKTTSKKKSTTSKEVYSYVVPIVGAGTYDSPFKPKYELEGVFYTGYNESLGVVTVKTHKKLEKLPEDVKLV